MYIPNTYPTDGAAFKAVTAGLLQCPQFANKRISAATIQRHTKDILDAASTRITNDRRASGQPSEEVRSWHELADSLQELRNGFKVLCSVVGMLTI